VVLVLEALELALEWGLALELELAPVLEVLGTVQV